MSTLIKHKALSFQTPVAIDNATIATGDQLQELMTRAAVAETLEETLNFVQFAEIILQALQGQIHANIAIRNASK